MERLFPEVARRGILVGGINPQPEIRKNAETAPGWEYADEAKYLYRMASQFKERFLDCVIRPDRDRLPDPVIAFEDLRNRNTLACYLLVRNPIGLQCEITMNTEHYKDVVDADGKKKRSGYLVDGHNWKLSCTSRYICGNRHHNLEKILLYLARFTTTRSL